MNKAIETNTTFQAEFRIVRDDGKLCWMEGYGHVVETLNGNPIRMSGVMSDISERKRNEEVLLQAQAELEKRVQERTRDLYESNAILQSEIAKRIEMEAERQRLLGRIVASQEEERRRFSRELHDSLGQQLTALRLGIERFAGKNFEQSDQRSLELQEMIKRMDAEVDFMARELRPTSLDELGLVSALGNFVEEWSALFKIPADFHAHGIHDDRLTPEIEVNLYRIAQEALNNVSKHAKATQVAVILERRDREVILILEDNGTGFALHKEPIPHVADRGLGLIGMRERVLLIGGTLEIESSSGNGTTIFVRVPIPSPG